MGGGGRCQPAVRGIRFSQVRWKTTSPPSLQTTSLEVMKSVSSAPISERVSTRTSHAISGRCSRIAQSERVRAESGSFSWIVYVSRASSVNSRPSG